MKLGSLFSGIGGFELGLERAIPGLETVWQVEQVEFCQKVLQKHWPHAKIYDDVRNINKNNVEPIDILCGGFPCQDISLAGKGEGINGKKSGLWWEMHRIISELRPRIAIMENVPAITFRGLDSVLGSLSEIGYDAEWCIISAKQFGAPHPRKRWFCVAYPHGGSDAIQGNERESNQSSSERTAPDSEKNCRWEESGREAKFHNRGHDNLLSESSNSNGSPGKRNGSIIGIQEKFLPDCGSSSHHQESPNPKHQNGFSGLSSGWGLESERETQQRINDGGQYSSGAGDQEGGCYWERFPTQPPLCHRDDGVSNRLARLRALGNAIVPQCSQWIGEQILNSGLLEGIEMTNEEKLEMMAKLGEELGHVVTLREDPKPVGADPQVWEMLDKPRAVYKEDQRTLKNVVRPRPNRKNLAIIFENDSKYQNVEYHDHSTALLLDGEVLDKSAWEDIALDLEERYRLEVNDTMLRASLFRVGFHNQIHPIRDYLDGLEWDGEHRLERYATDILKAETTPANEELIRVMSLKMFIGPVARIYDPGCEMHAMPIFIGDKGVGKSMCIKLVSPRPEWFDRTPLKIGDKSCLEHIHQTGVWLQEMAELADFHGKHANKIKSFLTTEKDRYRIVYDRDLVYKSRRICFFGTSNDYQILDDGWERRFWIFKLQSKVDLGWIVENKDQLWAEAVHWYKSGKEWHLVPHEEEMLRTYQESFLVDDPWAWGVAECINGKMARGEPGATTDEIMAYIELPVSQRHTGNSRRIAQICRDNGFVLKRTHKNGRFWTKIT